MIRVRMFKSSILLFFRYNTETRQAPILSFVDIFQNKKYTETKIYKVILERD